MLYSVDYESPVGKLTLAADEKALVGLWMSGQRYFGSSLQVETMCHEIVPVLGNAVSWLDAYFAGGKPSLENMPLEPQGTDFQLSVWKALRTIPYGKTSTYGAIARQLSAELGRNVSPCAVGNAVGHNPISIIIPCHRVVGANGSLTGYAGGLERKKYLLQLEGVNLSVPVKKNCNFANNKNE